MGDNLKTRPAPKPETPEKPAVVESSPAKEKASESEMHYKELLAYFKYLIGATGTAAAILLAIAGFMLHKNLAEVKQDAKEEAKRVATLEAGRGVDEAFRSNNIMAIVESAAKRQASGIVQAEAREAIELSMGQIQQKLTSLGQLADAGMRMRVGLRVGLSEMRRLQVDGPDDQFKADAKAMFESIAKDYETVAKARREPQSGRGGGAILTERIESASIAGAIDDIRKESNLNWVADAFLILREKTGYPFKMFDLDAVDNWAKANPSKMR